MAPATRTTTAVRRSWSAAGLANDDRADQFITTLDRQASAAFTVSRLVIFSQGA
jgi:hypothetical protein